MLSPRWRKVLGDGKAAQGRLALMVAALAVSVAALTTMLSAYAVLKREVSRNYLGTNPAAAQLVVDKVDEAVAQSVRGQAGVADAEASSMVRARVVTGDGEVRPALLFVVPDLRNSRINSVRLTSGVWPASNDAIVLERTAVGVARAAVGQSLVVELARGTRQTLKIVGTVHDPSLAPAWQEQAVYGYITPAALTRLGGDTDLHILKLVVNRPGAITQEIAEIARGVAQWLRQSGHSVQEIRIPPPGMHPHQPQMMTLLVMLLVFSALGLLVGSVLGATIVGGLLATQIRDIAVMKAVGARTGQIAALYLALVGLVALLAVGIGTPLGLAAGRAWAGASAQLLNLEIDSYAVPAWVLMANALSSILIPLAAAVIPIARASRRTVREAISDAGISRDAVVAGRFERSLTTVSALGSVTTLGFRNAFRRRGRLLLTIALLTTAGGVFITSSNLRSAWYENIAASAAARHYDLEIEMQQPVPEQTVKRVLRSLAGVRQVESWPVSAVNVDPGDHIEISSVYPDEGHGRITLRAALPSTELMGIDLIAGRWLLPNDGDAVVINSTAQAIAFPHISVGETVDLLVRHQPRRLKIVGIVREVMTPGAVYATPQGFSGDDFPVGTTNAARVALVDRSQAEVIAKTATEALEREGVAVRAVITEKLIRAAQTGHIRILVYALGFIAATMALVGTLGLASMLSSSVTERTREFGVMRAIGARATDIRRIVLGEALVGGILGAAFAIPASLPLSAIVAKIVGRVSTQPLGLGLGLSPIVVWFVIATIASIGAALYPSFRASRLTVREALAVS